MARATFFLSCFQRLSVCGLIQQKNSTRAPLSLCVGRIVRGLCFDLQIAGNGCHLACTHRRPLEWPHLVPSSILTIPSSSPLPQKVPRC